MCITFPDIALSGHPQALKSSCSTGGTKVQGRGQPTYGTERRCRGGVSPPTALGAEGEAAAPAINVPTPRVAEGRRAFFNVRVTASMPSVTGESESVQAGGAPTALQCGFRLVRFPPSSSSLSSALW
eukprot:CAMPEP_0172202872 /NCGR_PEP_ID=MMETSP1050-20130122/30932_1 /TAXON_ID=233186 /ORGANISM="Cryptomonas curvata, Strain CCAP979/52" /LENGTH=126 /DNA_ID=CAMNT_0012880949 /DNA_START=480 /DNA_END=857 /DNA_ORIENTATION=+